MIRAAAGLCAVSCALALASGAEARTVDYAVLETSLETVAADLEVDPAAPMPATADFDFVLEGEAAADHRVRYLAIACSAHDVDNPASQIVRSVLTGMDRNRDLATTTGTAVTVRIDEAASFMRCFFRGEADGRCIGRTTMRATMRAPNADGSTREVVLNARVEKTLDTDGFCGGMSQGVGFVSREAAIQLAGRVAEALAAPAGAATPAVAAAPASPETPAAAGSPEE